MFTKGAWNGEVLGGYAQNDTTISFDNPTNYQFSFFGARLARTTSFGVIEGLWVQSDRSNAAYDPGVADERRDTFSLRATGHAGPVDFDVEGIAQVGRWGVDKVRAGYVSANAAYLVDRATQTKIGARLESASGDTNRNDHVMGTYFSLFSRPITLNGELGRSNLTFFGPSASIQPTRKLTLNVNFDDLLRTTANDGIYMGSGAVLRPAIPGGSHQVGTRFIFAANYTVSPFISVGAYFNHVWAGQYLKESAIGADLNYTAFYTTFRF